MILSTSLIKLKNNTFSIFGFNFLTVLKRTQTLCVLYIQYYRTYLFSSFLYRFL